MAKNSSSILHTNADQIVCTNTKQDVVRPTCVQVFERQACVANTKFSRLSFSISFRPFFAFSVPYQRIEPRRKNAVLSSRGRQRNDLRTRPKQVSFLDCVAFTVLPRRMTNNQTRDQHTHAGTRIRRTALSPGCGAPCLQLHSIKRILSPTLLPPFRRAQKNQMNKLVDPLADASDKTYPDPEQEVYFCYLNFTANRIHIDI